MPDEMQGAVEQDEERAREEREAAKAALLALIEQLRTAGVSEPTLADTVTAAALRKSSSRTHDDNRSR